MLTITAPSCAVPARAPDDDVRSPVGSVIAVLLVAAAWLQGGFYPRAQLILAGLALLAVVAALVDRRLRPGRWLGAAALVTAGWTVARGVGAGRPLDALAPAALALAVVGVAGAVAGLDASGRRLVSHTLTGVGLVESVLGVVAVAAHWTGPGRIDGGLWRATTTVTYENAAAALLVICLLPLIGRGCGDAPRYVCTRAAAGSVLLLGLLATASRGGVLSIAVGLVVLLVAYGPRRVGGAFLPALLGAGIGGLALVPSMPAGSHPHLLLAGGGALLGASVAFASGRHARLAAGALAAAGAGVGAALLVGAHVPGLSTLLHARVHVTDTARGGLSSAATHQIAGHPLFGVGSGTQLLRVTAGPGDLLLDRFAHDEYLQVLWKLGAVGLVAVGLLLVAAVSRLLGPRPARGRRSDRDRWAAPLAAVLALLAGSSLDFLWHLPLLPLTGAVLVGLAVPPIEETP